VKREVKVGIFVLIGLIVAGAITFLVGDERRLFDKHFTLNTTFENVAGLKPGAPVRMGGVDVGTVSAVKLGPDPADKRMHVRFTVVRAAHERIRKDSIVTISNKGLLGDKMLEVTLGSESQPVIPDDGSIPSEPPEDFQKYLTKANEIMESTRRVLKNVEAFTGTASDPKVIEDVKASIAATRKLLDDASRNDGFVHRLLTDPKMADHLDQVFIEGARAGKSFDRVAHELQVILTQAKQGPGVLHTLLYGKEGEAIVKNLSDASGEFAATMKEVRTGKGAAHELIYGETGTAVAKDLAAIVADLKKMVDDVKAGKGTLGALIVDPSIYEDLKTILGNLDRNQVLRAIVRYTIKQDESNPSPAVKTPPAPAASAK
jgi:phospholipid/cholesterol/gamma-HCH transport system substrate-binding protein